MSWRRALVLVGIIGVILGTTLGYRYARRAARQTPTPTELATALDLEPAERPAIFRALLENNDPASLETELLALCPKWSADYEGFLKRLLEQGYRIEPVEAFDPSRLGEKIAYLRHDIHDWDLAGAPCMMAIENSLRIGATYYLMWDYQKLETSKRDYFLALKKLAGQRHRFGLHAGVTDEFFYETYYQKRGPVLPIEVTDELVKSPLYRTMANPTVLQADAEWPEILVFPPVDTIANSQLRDLARFGRARIREHLTSMRTHFGVVTTLAVHGGCMSVSVEKAYQQKPPIDGRFLSSTEHFLDQAFMREVGLTYCADHLPRHYDDLIFVTDNPGKIELFNREVDEAVQQGKSLLILVHPSLWERQLIQRSLGTGPNWRESTLSWWDWKALRRTPEPRRQKSETPHGTD